MKLLNDLWFYINCRSNTCSELAICCADFMWIMEQHSHKWVSKHWLMGESSLADGSGLILTPWIARNGRQCVFLFKINGSDFCACVSQSLAQCLCEWHDPRRKLHQRSSGRPPGYSLQPKSTSRSFPKTHPSLPGQTHWGSRCVSDGFCITFLLYRSVFIRLSGATLSELALYFELSL